MTDIVARYWRTVGSADKWFAGSILLFLGFIGIDWDIAKNGAYLAVLIALGVLIFARGAAKEPRAALSRLEWVLIAVIFLWIAHSLLSWWVNGMPEHGDAHIKGRQAKLLLFIPLYLFVRKRGMPDAVLWSGAALGVLIVGIHGLTLFFQHGSMYALKGLSEQGEGHYTLQIAALMATLTAYLWVAGLRYMRFRKPAAWVALAVSLVGLAFVFASGSRGSWIALAAAGLVLLVYSLREIGWKAWLFVFAVCMLLAVSFYKIPFAKNGLERIYTEVYRYVEKDVTKTSAGIRLDLWRAALVLGKKNPVFGVGSGRFSDAVARQFPEKQWLQPFEYPHNQYFAALGSRGVPGLLFLLLLLGLPGFVFWKRFREGDESLRFIAVAGLMLVVTFAVAGLSYDLLEKRLPIVFYAVNLALLLGMLRYRASEVSGGERLLP